MRLVSLSSNFLFFKYLLLSYKGKKQDRLSSSAIQWDSDELKPVLKISRSMYMSSYFSCCNRFIGCMCCCSRQWRRCHSAPRWLCNHVCSQSVVTFCCRHLTVPVRTCFNRSLQSSRLALGSVRMI